MIVSVSFSGQSRPNIHTSGNLKKKTRKSPIRVNNYTISFIY